MTKTLPDPAREPDSFSPDWLALREPADHRARNDGLVEDMIGHMKTRLANRPDDEAGMTIVDLGCGTGSTFRALAPALRQALPDRPQLWVFADHDARLLERAKALNGRFMRTALDVASALHPQSGQNRKAAGDRKAPKTEQIDMVWVECDLSGTRVLEDLISRHEADLVTASALFDLVSDEWLQRLAHALRDAPQPAMLYAALNYNGQEQWSPPHPDDAAILTAFNAHQQTDKGFGPATGGQSMRLATDIFTQAGFTVSTADSSWHLDDDTRPLISMLAEGIASAVRQTGDVLPAQCDQWLAQRKSATRAIIHHEDLLAISR